VITSSASDALRTRTYAKTLTFTTRGDASSVEFLAL
jgi:hypothetical protein